MPEPGNGFCKNQHWRSLLAWLQENANNPDPITALSLEVSQGASKVNVLGALSGFRPTADDKPEHRACAQIIVTVFYKAGLINLKIGKSEETALLKAVTVGNFEIASMLLDHGAGHPPCIIPFFFIRELLFGTP